MRAKIFQEGKNKESVLQEHYILTQKYYSLMNLLAH